VRSAGRKLLPRTAPAAIGGLAHPASGQAGPGRVRANARAGRAARALSCAHACRPAASYL